MYPISTNGRANASEFPQMRWVLSRCDKTSPRAAGGRRAGAPRESVAPLNAALLVAARRVPPPFRCQKIAAMRPSGSRFLQVLRSLFQNDHAPHVAGFDSRSFSSWTVRNLPSPRSILANRLTRTSSCYSGDGTNSGVRVTRTKAIPSPEAVPPRSSAQCPPPESWANGTLLDHSVQQKNQQQRHHRDDGFHDGPRLQCLGNGHVKIFLHEPKPAVVDMR